MPPGLAPPTKYEEIKATRKMRWWYESLADLMIANPMMKQNDLATHFNRSPSSISIIINSDAFQAYLRKRRSEYTSNLDASVRQKMLQVADVSFDLILDRFEKKRDSIPLETLQKVQETALKGLGFGNSGPGVVVNTGPQMNGPVTVAVGVDDLQAAQNALRQSQLAKPPLPVVEAEFTEVETPSASGETE